MTLLNMIRNISPKKDDTFTVVFTYARYGKGADIVLRILRHFIDKKIDFQAIIILGRGFIESLAVKFLEL